LPKSSVCCRAANEVEADCGDEIGHDSAHCNGSWRDQKLREHSEVAVAEGREDENGEDTCKEVQRTTSVNVATKTERGRKVPMNERATYEEHAETSDEGWQNAEGETQLPSVGPHTHQVRRVVIVCQAL